MLVPMTSFLGHHIKHRGLSIERAAQRGFKRLPILGGGKSTPIGSAPTDRPGAPAMGVGDQRQRGNLSDARWSRSLGSGNRCVWVSKPKRRPSPPSNDRAPPRSLESFPGPSCRWHTRCGRGRRTGAEPPPRPPRPTAGCCAAMVRGRPSAPRFRLPQNRYVSFPDLPAGRWDHRAPRRHPRSGSSHRGVTPG